MTNVVSTLTGNYYYKPEIVSKLSNKIYTQRL